MLKLKEHKLSKKAPNILVFYSSTGVVVSANNFGTYEIVTVDNHIEMPKKDIVLGKRTNLWNK